MAIKYLKWALITWLLIIPIAIINGSIRNFVYQPLVGPLLGHQISSFTGSIAILVLTYFMLRNHIKDLSDKQLLQIGLLWLGLTILFEFGFGHYIAGNPWEKLLHDYNILEGRLWIVVLLTTFLAPFIVKRTLKLQV
jgi:hypothetical protein